VLRAQAAYSRMTCVDDPGAAVGSVGCTIDFAVATPVEIALQVAVAWDPARLLGERLDVLGNGHPVAVRELPGTPAGRQHLLHADPGPLTITYDARFAALPWGRPTPAPVCDTERVEALRPSRYCPSDRFVGFARSHFDQAAPADRVRAICAYVHRHIAYVAGTSEQTTDAADTLLAGQGVCRDFAHLVIALCRAVDVPARFAAVYAPGLWPMDLHAVAETELDGVWRVWDATRLAPRSTLVRIATGRDAADAAFATVLSGQAQLTGLSIGAYSGAELPFDDHEQPVSLR
jgi:transglutaminase-like putative cysteine protease